MSTFVKYTSWLRPLMLLLAALFSLPSPAPCHTPSSPIYLPDTQAPKYETRAVWLTTIGGIDWPRTHALSPSSAQRQRDELCTLLDRLKAANVNTILFQVRIRGTVIYPSSLEPWDICLTGQPGQAPDYDPLLFAIDESHKRGMELHAWVVTLPIGKWKGAGARNMQKKHKNLVMRVGDEAFMRPELDATADYLGNVCADICRRYDVDGIHLDYIRYPEKYKGKGTADSKRANITRIVRTIRQAVKSQKPWVKLSCSPIGKHDDVQRYRSKGWNARSTVYQDAQEWLRQGLMDVLFPMMYFRDNDFYPFAADWQEHAYGRTIAAGLGIYMMLPSERNWQIDDIEREMWVLRQLGLGRALFRAQFFSEDLKGIYQKIRQDLDRYPSLVPPITWENAVPPLQPSQVWTMADGNKLTIEWTAATALNDSPNLLYNVYASADSTPDVSSGRHIIATRLPDTWLTLRRPAGSRPLHIAVTAVDRYGNESTPTYFNPPTATAGETSAWLQARSDGRLLLLPDKPSTLWADVLVVKNAMGIIVASFPYHGKFADISMLPTGAYTLYAVNRKQYAHRIGHFLKPLTTDHRTEH